VDELVGTRKNSERTGSKGWSGSLIDLGHISGEDVYQELRDEFPIVEERVKKNVER
jgi:hypothetical protein